MTNYNINIKNNFNSYGSFSYSLSEHVKNDADIFYWGFINIVPIRTSGNIGVSGYFTLDPVNVNPLTIAPSPNQYSGIFTLSTGLLYKLESSICLDRDRNLVGIRWEALINDEWVKINEYGFVVKLNGRHQINNNCLFRTPDNGNFCKVRIGFITDATQGTMVGWLIGKNSFVNIYSIG